MGNSNNRAIAKKIMNNFKVDEYLKLEDKENWQILLHRALYDHREINTLFTPNEIDHKWLNRRISVNYLIDSYLEDQVEMYLNDRSNRNKINAFKSMTSDYRNGDYAGKYLSLCFVAHLINDKQALAAKETAKGKKLEDEIKLDENLLVLFKQEVLTGKEGTQLDIENKETITYEAAKINLRRKIILKLFEFDVKLVMDNIYYAYTNAKYSDEILAEKAKSLVF